MSSSNMQPMQQQMLINFRNIRQTFNYLLLVSCGAPCEWLINTAMLILF